MSQLLVYLNFPIREVPESSYNFGLTDTGPGLNQGNFYYHQSVVERHPNLVPAFADFKDLDDVDPFNASGVDGRKESKQGRVVLYVTAVIKSKNPLVGNGQAVQSLSTL